MVSPNFAKRMMNLVKEGNGHPKQATIYLARSCTCEVLNLVCAERVLEEYAVEKAGAPLRKRRAEYVLQDVSHVWQGPLTVRLRRGNMAIGQNWRT